MDLVFEALDKRHMGEDRIISAKEIDELRAISGHVLRVSQVQVPEDDLDDLHWIREEDGEFKTADPQFLLGSKMLEGIDPKMPGVLLVSLGGTMRLEVILVKGHFVSLIVNVLPVDCDPLALVEGITPVENNKGLLVVCLVSNAACFCVVLNDSLGS
ncbi:hypothetical protein Tco_1091917 [Tanacetum coccineum]|uniref:Uncharacterized protein n=1 Tax=Tanacetum coccineum TaxID=301880 RepID=A0ABQ5I8D6_9ASTR